MGVPWAVHHFAYTPGLPDSLLARASIEFELVSGVLGRRAEKVRTLGGVSVSEAGLHRRLLTVVAEAPEHRPRTWVRSVRAVIEEVTVGSVEFHRRDGVTTERAYSVLGGEPYRYTFHREERLALRNALSTVELKRLPGEVTRWKVPGLERHLLAETPYRRPLNAVDMHAEVVRQISGAYRADTWGYLWKWVRPPMPSDGPMLTMSKAMTPSMSSTLHDLTETLLRATGVKPLPGGFDTGAQVIDAVAYALVAARRRVPVVDVAHHVVTAIERYGDIIDLRELEGGAWETDDQDLLAGFMPAYRAPEQDARAYAEDDLFPEWASDPIRRPPSSN